jgi:hypothetical protein
MDKQLKEFTLITQRYLDRALIVINVLAPFVGVMWFDWAVTEVVFLYGVEAGSLTLYHAIAYWQTYLRITDRYSKDLYLGFAALRVGIEGMLVLGAFTLLIDSITGRLSTIFDEYQILLDYAWATLLPTLAILWRYGRLIEQRIRQSQPIAPVGLTKLWVWVIVLPLPAFIYSYVLVSPTDGWFIGLLVLITVLHGLAEYVQVTGRDVMALPQIADPGVLRSSPYSGSGQITLLWSYVLVGVGFFAVNPFTQDARFSPTQNVLIYVAFVAVVLPWLVRRRMTIRLDTQQQLIQLDLGRFVARPRTIPLHDITSVMAKRNGHGLAYRYTFTVKGQPHWICSLAAFHPTEWLAWVEQLQQAAPYLAVPAWQDSRARSVA